MIFAINFATLEYEKARKFNTRTAYKYGADKVIEYSLKDIDDAFTEKNKEILQQKRGSGYWLWKPYFINRAMECCKEGDWVLYSDAGMIYRKSIRKYIHELQCLGIEMLSRTTKFQERQFTKRDVFIELECDVPEYTDTLQRAASVIIMKNTYKTRKIISEWLENAQNKHLITDEKCIYGKNYKEFIDHRHDQSLFSIICKKYQVYCNKDVFLDIVIPIHGHALLLDHHSKKDKYITAYLYSIGRVIKILYHDAVRKWSRKS